VGSGVGLLAVLTVLRLCSAAKAVADALAVVILLLMLLLSVEAAIRRRL
jgi:hypothetical protein